MQTDDHNQWERLENLWQEAPVRAQVPDALRERVTREQRRLWTYAVMEWALAIMLFTWGGYQLAAPDSRLDLLQGGLVVSFTAIAMLLSSLLRRHAWIPKGEDAQSYLALTERRIRLGWLTLRYVWMFFTLEAIVFIGLDVAERSGLIELPLSSTVFVVLFLAVFALALSAWSVWYARVLRARETALRELKRALAL